MNCDPSVGGRRATSRHPLVSFALPTRASASPLRHSCIGALIATLAVLGGGDARPVFAASAVPRLDHVIVVVMENKTYDQARSASFTASLIAQSSSFSRSYAPTHPSQPNYLALWSGSAQGVVDDNCPPSGSPFHSENLGHACEMAGLTWKAYCENLPSSGSAACSGPLYLRRHAPWTDFSNLTHSNEVSFTQLAIDESRGALPTLAFVIPNTCDDTHDSGCSVAYGDAWLQRNLPSLMRAGGPNGVLILTWDEDDGSAGNHILTVFSGPRVRPGYVSSTRITHDTVLRTICAALGLPAFGAAVAESEIADVWTGGGNATCLGARRSMSRSTTPTVEESATSCTGPSPAWCASPGMATRARARSPRLGSTSFA
jgi:hypothetical protein